MKALKDLRTRRKWFLISLGLLLAFAFVGQMGIDEICLASERGRFYKYPLCLPFMGITAAVTIASIGLVFLAVRFFPVRTMACKVLAWALGLFLAGWMLLGTGMIICHATDSEDVYGAAGWWIGYVDKLEEEKMVWNRSHWFGHGDEVYKYSYEEFMDAHSHISFEYEGEEPYQSILDERYKKEHVFFYLYSDTMINVLSYFYGRWVWLAYSLLALGSAILVSFLWPLAGGLPGKLLYGAGWVLYAVMTLLPALHGCALVHDRVGGPLFTGIGIYYLKYGAGLAGAGDRCHARACLQEKGKPERPSL